MEDSKIGILISRLRKEKGYSQKDLAEKLLITETDISLWETGKELPKTTLHKRLSEILEVSIDELLIAEENTSKVSNENKKEVFINSLKYLGQTSNILINIFLILIGCVILLIPIFKGTINNNYFCVYGAFFIILAIWRIIFKHLKINVSSSYKALYSFVLLSQVTAVILEMFNESLALPYSNGPNKYIIQTYSYFSLFPPFGSGQYSPIFTGILTIVVIVLSIIILINKAGKSVKLRNADFVCSILAFVFSVLLFYRTGIDYLSTPNYVIAILILLSAVLQIVANRRIISK